MIKIWNTGSPQKNTKASNESYGASTEMDGWYLYLEQQGV